MINRNKITSNRILTLERSICLHYKRRKNYKLSVELFIVKRFALIFLIIVALFNQPLFNQPQMTQGAGESVATAFTIPFDTTLTGLLHHENDIDYFNYTVSGDYNIRHVFTLTHTANELFGIALYDHNFDILAFNAQVRNQKSDSASGYNKYIIGIFATDKTITYPASYQLRVHKDTTLMPIGSNSMELGDNKGFINPLDDNDRLIEKWYNFSGSASNEYTFKLLETNTFLSMEIFDSNLNFIASDYGFQEELSLTLSGHSKYIIGIGGNDTTVYPVDYTVSISDVTKGEIAKYTLIVLFTFIIIFWIIINRSIKIED